LGAGNFTASGRARVQDGTVTFQKKTFDVTKGIIDFVNPYKTVAEIDLKGQTRVRTWTIFLTAEGTPDNLDVSLTSQPAETEADFLSLRCLHDGQRRLRDLAIFHGVGYRTFGLLEKEETAHLFVEVEENKPYYAEAGGGYESDSGFFGRVKIGDRNLLGRNKHLWAGGELSQTGHRVETRLTDYSLDVNTIPRQTSSRASRAGQCKDSSSSKATDNSTAQTGMRKRYTAMLESRLY
jgi:hypothetical protein